MRDSLLMEMRDFYLQGLQDERERIIALLEPLAQHSELCAGGCHPEDCSAFAYEYALGLIKGENNER